MKKRVSWKSALFALAYVVPAFFVGAIFLSVVEAFGTWINSTGLNAIQWDVMAVISGAIIILLFHYFIRTPEEVEKRKNKNK